MKREIDLQRRNERESCFKGIKTGEVKNCGRQSEGKF